MYRDKCHWVWTIWGILLSSSIHVLTVLGQLGTHEEIQRLYVKQGIPYGQNVFLDDLPILPEYDFIVIGSGPGGSVIANRLSEIPEWKVLLLEKGQEGSAYNDIPLLNPPSQLSKYSKFYEVKKTPNACHGINKGICHWPAGEAVGGATIINGMLYTRGHPTDFDEWAAEGNPGWSYKDVLPYFLKYEKMTIPSLQKSEFHGNKGPVQIEYPFQTKIGKRFLKAGNELGYDVVDYNNPFTMYGFSSSQTTMKSGKRVSAHSAYLLPAKDRPNLHVAKNTPVSQIVIDPVTKKAKGVKFLRQGNERTVCARKEVILSAGSFNSPKLLMLSGIGLDEHLSSLNITVLANLPVGDGLQEHLGTPLLNFFINAPEAISFQRLLLTASRDFAQWFSGKGGIYSNNGVEALAYIKSPLAKNKSDVEFIFLPVTFGSDGGVALRRTLNFKDELFYDMFKDAHFREGFLICPMAMYPKSKGSIRLISNKFNDPPIIDGNFFADPYDVQVIIEGVKAAIKLSKTKVFQEVGATQHSTPLKLCKQHPFNSDKYWKCAIRAVPIQLHHQCCTCRMGSSPANSVVDTRLRVHGIQGLRVVDASVMPKLPGPHTMASTYMIGERAADFIKKDWGMKNNE